MLSKLATGLFTSPTHQILFDKCRHSPSNEGIQVGCALNINNSITYSLFEIEILTFFMARLKQSLPFPLYYQTKLHFEGCEPGYHTIAKPQFSVMAFSLKGRSCFIVCLALEW